MPSTKTLKRTLRKLQRDPNGGLEPWRVNVIANALCPRFTVDYGLVNQIIAEAR